MTRVIFKNRSGDTLEGDIVGSLRDGRHWVRVYDCPLTPVWFGGKLHKSDYTDYPVSYDDMEVVDP